MAARHHEVTRLEGFSDAVFGFAPTLLVVSLEGVMGPVHGWHGSRLARAKERIVGA